MFTLPEFKLIVAGGRDFNNYEYLSNALFELSDTTYALREVSIVSGMARGADSLAVRFAKEYNVQLYEFPADWRPNGIYNPGAGHIRNEKMGRFADGLLAFWDGKSRGTSHMVDFMSSLNKPVHLRHY